MDNYSDVKTEQSVKPAKPHGSMTAKMCNCPVCNKVMRIDKVVLHSTRVHKKELITSMFKCDMDLVLKHQIPYVFGTYKDERILEGCLVCGKGCTGKAKKISSHTVASRIPKIKQEHSECMKLWKDYESLYTEFSGPQVSLPYKLERMERDAVKTVKPVEVAPIVVGLGDEEKALLKKLMDILDPQPEGWEDDEDEDDEPESVKDQLLNAIRIAERNQKGENKFKATIEKLNKRVETLEEQLEEARDAASEESTSSSLPADVADLQELLAEAKEREAGFKEEIESLRSQLFAANMNAQALPTLEVSEKTEALEAELEELREAYDKLRTEAVDREAELEAEIEGMVARGTVEPSLLGPLNKVFYIDSDHRDVEDPTVNDMVRGVISIAKEALIQTEKDQILMKQYGKRIQQLETLISRDFD